MCTMPSPGSGLLTLNLVTLDISTQVLRLKYYELSICIHKGLEFSYRMGHRASDMYQRF